MNNKEVLYGIEINENILSEFGKDIIVEFVFSLFISPSTNYFEAKIFIDRIQKTNSEFIKKIIDINKKESVNFTDKLRNNDDKNSLEIYKKEVIKKIIDWMKVSLQLKHEETKEYINFYNLENTEIMDIEGSRTLTVTFSPNDIKSKIDKFIIGQEHAKKEISMVFYLHLLRTGKIKPEIYNEKSKSRMETEIDLPKPNMMLLGPTGSGKTFIIKSLCEMFKIPFIKIDCASLTSSGYYGYGINDYMYMLYKKTGSAKECENAIIYFDEFDKISEIHTGQHGSVGGIELQQEFLTLLEDEEYVILPPKNSPDSQIRINIKNIMYIFSGSFAGIEKIIEKRYNKTLGFNSNNKVPENLLAKIESSDIINFGILPELVGRVNYFIPLESLNKEDIFNILTKSTKSPVIKYQNFFYIHYDELVIEDDVYMLIAEEVVKIGMGGRGINTVLQKLLGELMFSSPNLKKEKFVINKEIFNKIFRV